jgi:hypothetical protein
MFYGFAEVADWRAFQHFDQIRELLENRRYTSRFSIGLHESGEKIRVADGGTDLVLWSDPTTIPSSLRPAMGIRPYYDSMLCLVWLCGK